MVEKLRVLAKSLLIYWAVNFIVIGISTVLLVFIGYPILMLILKGTIESLPNWDDIYKSIKLVFLAALITGTVLWMKEEVFENHD